MFTKNPGLMGEIRDLFADVDSGPFEGPRILVKTWARFAAIPDKQERGNLASAAFVDISKTANADTHSFFGTSRGRFLPATVEHSCCFH